MHTKSLRGVEIKNADKGEVTAVFSTFDVIDSDMDVTVAGAFEDGAPVRISSYNHTSWGGMLPVGKGTIRQTKNEAILEGEFFMDVAAGRDTFTVVKEMGDLQEWSYGYDPVEFSFGEFDGQQVRFLNKLKVHEVSPVMLGAGVGTRTLAAKSANSTATRRGVIAAHETEVVSRSWDSIKMAGGLPEQPRPSELRSVYAWVDPDADPELKGSYRLAHHHGVGGPANIRACLMHIAALNAGKGLVPDGHRDGVYQHLAGHLRDADVEVPELKAQPGGSMKFHEEGHAVLAAASSFIDRASEVLALRARKGRTGLAPSSAELLGWVGDELKRLEHLLSAPTGDDDPTDDEIASVIARSLAQINGF